MASISFKLQSIKSPAEISVRVRNGRAKDLLVKIGRKINVSDWDPVKGMPRHNRTTELKQISQAITDIKSRILANLDEDISLGKNIDSDWVREQINPNLKKEISNKLIDHFDFYLSLKKDSISKNTIKKINTFKSVLITFEKWAKKNYQINEVDIAFLDKLISFSKNPTFNYHQNYIVDLLKYIKTICSNAGKHGIKENPQTKMLKINKIKTPKLYLNEDDLKKIKAVELKQEYLDNARDWLLISCETGQRVGDFLRFKSDMIQTRITKKKRNAQLIEFQQEKTQKQMSVVIMPLVKEILTKRNGEFPRKISAQRYNEYIKIVCKEAGLTYIIEAAIKDEDTKRLKIGKYEKYKCVASHIGRRSFASNYYSKYPTSLLMQQTGHSSERTFLEYIGKSKSDMSLDFHDAIYK